MTITVAQLAGKARRDAGNPSIKDIEETDIERHIEDAIKESSRYVPNRAMYSLTLVEEQQSYTTIDGLEEGLSDINDVYPFSTGASIADLFGGEFDALMGKDLNYGWQMSQYNRLVGYLNKVQADESFDWDFQPSGALFILPPPASYHDGKELYYVGVKDWGIDNLPEKLHKLIIKYATGQVLLIIGRYRSRIAAPTRKGTAQDWSQYDPIMKDGNRILREWRNEMEAESARRFWR